MCLNNSIIPHLSIHFKSNYDVATIGGYLHFDTEEKNSFLKKKSSKIYLPNCFTKIVAKIGMQCREFHN